MSQDIINRSDHYKTGVIELPPAEERCSFCKKRIATKLCDFVTSEIWTTPDFQTHRLTCDKPICDQCAFSMNEVFDFCPKHREYVRNLLIGSDIR